MKKNLLLLLFLPMLVWGQTSNPYGIDSEVWNLFQTQSKFSKSIDVSLPEESSQEMYNDIKNEPVKSQSLKVTVYVGASSIDRIYTNKKLIPFLIKEGLAEIKSAAQIEYSAVKCYDFLFYTAKLKNQIQKVKRELTSDYDYQLNVAERKLIDVTYKNKYEDINLQDGKRWYYIFRYKYVVVNKYIDNNRFPSKTYEGYFKVMLNPDNGKWQYKEESMDASDNDEKSRIMLTKRTNDEFQEVDRLIKAYPQMSYSQNCDSLIKVAKQSQIEYQNEKREEDRQIKVEQERLAKEEVDNNSTFLKIPTISNNKTAYLKVLPIINKGNVDANTYNYFKNLTIDNFVNVMRYRVSSKEEFEKAEKQQQYVLQVGLNNFMYRNLSLQANVLDYEAQIYFDYALSCAESPIRSENLVYRGGDAMFADTKEQALAGLTIALKKWNKIIAYLFFNIECNVLSVTDEDKKKIKEVALDNSDYLDHTTEIGFVFYKKGTNYNVSATTLNSTEVIAVGELKKQENGKAICKIVSGGEKLKELLDMDEKVVAISTIERYAKNFKIK